MTTKEKILAEALKQLNERGIDNVSIRSIANELGMSAGNLAYHYKNIDKIIFALYLQLIELMNVQLVEMYKQDYSLDWFWAQTKVGFTTFWGYRFLLLDFVVICRRDPSLHQHFLGLIEMRRAQMHGALETMVEREILDGTQLVGEYEDLVNRGLMFFNWWIPEAHITLIGHKTEEEIIDHNVHLFFSFFKPYFSTNGLEDYLRLAQA